jgi:DNA polymerase I-like protein with 3'-5' exonuclease and polymerase domains/uracil-DNA glycosylase
VKRDLTSLPIFDHSYAQCDGCELKPRCDAGKMVTAHRPKAFNGIMLVGEGPGQQEVVYKRPFTGASGRLLEVLLKSVGIERDDCYITNATLCLDGAAQIRLADGSTARLDNIVKHKQPLVVRTVNAEGRFTTAPINAWHRNRLGQRALLRVSFKHARAAGSKGRAGVLVTDDHPLLTDRGWLPAGAAYGCKIATDQLQPTGNAYAIAVASMVGDGCVTQRSTLKVSHGPAQRDYLHLKAEALGALGVTFHPPRKSDGHLSWTTTASAFFRKMRAEFHQRDSDGLRIIPAWFIAELSDLQLAVWFLDDGHLAMRGRGRQPNASLSTKSYSAASKLYLLQRLRALGFDCALSRGGVVLFSVAGTKALSRRIRAFVPECMQYKLLPVDRGFFETDTYALRPAAPFFDDIVLEERVPRGAQPRRLVYCLGVEGTHNFVTPGGVVHNCEPGRFKKQNKSLHQELPNVIPSCIGRLEAEIEAVRPKVIVALGATAWAALSGNDRVYERQVPFDCADCDPNRRIGPVLQCAASVPNPADGGSTAIPCGHFVFLNAALPEQVNPDELLLLREQPCPRCGAGRKRLRPKMIKCPTCGGRKRRTEQYTEWEWPFNVSDVAGGIFEPAPAGQQPQAAHELLAGYRDLGVEYIIPTLHPAHILRGQQFIAKSVQKHFAKAKRLLAGAKPVVTTHEVTSDPAVVRAFHQVQAAKAATGVLANISVDIETEAIGPDGAVLDAREIRNVTKITVIGFSVDGHRALVVDTRGCDPSNPDDPLLAALYDLLVDRLVCKTYHHGGGYDLPVEDKVWGIPVAEMAPSYTDDTMFGHANLYPDMPHKLGGVTFECADVRAWKPVRTVHGVEAHEDFDEHAAYNGRDVCHTALNRDYLGILNGKAVPGGRMDRAGLARVYEGDVRLRQIAVQMTMNGLPLDQKVFAEAGLTARKQVEDARVSLASALEEAGYPDHATFNPDSVPQLNKLLYGDQGFLHLPMVKQTESGAGATDKDTLLKLLGTSRDAIVLKILHALIDLRKHVYVERNFVKSDDFIPWADGRIHTVWKPWGTKTGRFSSSPNLQNWPIWLRAAIIAPDGRCIVGADADQLELRNLAWLSGDENLIARCLGADDKRKLEPEHDPHSYVASLAFEGRYTNLLLRDPNHDATAEKRAQKCKCETCRRKAMRDLTKRVIYGLNYGAGNQTVLEAIYSGGYEGPPITLDIIERVRRTVYKAFSRVPIWQAEEIKRARSSGELRSPLWGRRRIFPLALADLGMGVPETEIKNFPIQTLGADLMNEALILFADGLPDYDPDALIIAQIHDAIYAECDENRAEAVAKFLGECMSSVRTSAEGVVMKFTAGGHVSKTLKA